MDQKREEIKVGLMVTLAVLLFLAALIFVGGVNIFRRSQASYTSYFKFAGGLEPGSFVRFGGLKVGTVQAAGIDPQDSTRIRVRLQVAGGTPIRANSRARISTLGFLGENYVEVSPGTREAPILPPGSEIPSTEIVQLADVFNNANNVTVNANKLINDLDDRFLILADNGNQLLENLKDVVGPESRQHLASGLATADAILADSRPQVKNTLANLEAASKKLGPAIENANAAITRADTLIGNYNTLAVENRAAIHNALLTLQNSLVDARRLVADLDDSLMSNRENLDETLENIRATSENLKEFTDTIKRRPFSLVRVKAEKERIPPTGK